MNAYNSNYDKYPVVSVLGIKESAIVGWESILYRIRDSLSEGVVAFECYHGVNDYEVLKAIKDCFQNAMIFESSSAMKDVDSLFTILKDDITDDRIFGYLTRYNIDVYFDEAKVREMRDEISESSSLRIIYGVGSSYVFPNPDVLVYLDMARWEIQMRMRRHEVSSVGFNNKDLNPSFLYKQGYFVDWRILDRWKKRIWNRIDWFVDSNVGNHPKMVSSKAIDAGLEQISRRPFRVVPYFDPGIWGGQWMKQVCGLDKRQPNYAWCFDCVPEENSLYLAFGDVNFEIPSIDLVFRHPVELLGQNVYGRFGDEFPIRFDFLDTMEGGNLSLQVHPLIGYIQEKFGMHYTQEESYYLLDAKDDAHVYLGVKSSADSDEMISDLEKAQESGKFDAEKYVGSFPVKKHDHVLIPPGTIHCSGANSMVLEISATPYIFTFKLWDWGRVGLDGLPRPINISHGKNVIQWNRTEKWVRSEALNIIKPVASGDGWIEESTGLHESEFIETRRHWFTKTVKHNTDGGLNVLNLVEGREVVVESPSNAFAPYIVHYAETFIIPATVGEYTISPYGESDGRLCATIKAFIRK